MLVLGSWFLVLCTLYLEPSRTAKDKEQRTKNQAQSTKYLFKLCLSLRDKSLVSFTIIRMLHADRLRLGFGFERRFEIHVELAIQHLFRLRQCERRPACQSLRKLARHFCEFRR